MKVDWLQNSERNCKFCFLMVCRIGLFTGWLRLAWDNMAKYEDVTKGIQGSVQTRSLSIIGQV